MAHEVETMMYVGEPPWHRLGVKLNEAPSTREAIIAAGLNWDVEMTRIFVEKTQGSGLFQALPSDNQGVVRVTDRTVLGVVGPDYTPVQNVDAFKFFDPFIEQRAATIECAGSLRNGQRIWILAKLGSAATIVKGTDDVVDRYILLANAHNTSMSLRVGFTPVRVVCQNTLSAAIHGVNSNKIMKLKHTANVNLSLDKVKKIILDTSLRYDMVIEQYKELAKKSLKSRELVEYIAAVIKRPEITTYKELKENRIGGKILPLFEGGKGNDVTGVRGTLWAAYNAVTEHLTHYKGKDADIRLNSLWFGDSANTNDLALSTAMKMVA